MSSNIQIQGPQGPPGPAGSIGPRGLNGQSGVPGTRGERGPIGIKGEPGNVGEKGPNGIKGDKGEIGESIKGDKGGIGQKGEIGDIAPFVEKVVPCVNFQFMTESIGHTTQVDEGCMYLPFTNILTPSQGGNLFSINTDNIIPFMSNPCNTKLKVKNIGWSSALLIDNGIPSINTHGVANNKIPIGIKLVPFRFNKYHYNGLVQTNDIIDQFSGGNLSRITYFGTNDNKTINQPFKSIKSSKSDYVNYFEYDEDITTIPNPYTISMKDDPGGSVNVENMVLGIGEGLGIYIISDNNVGANFGGYVYTQLKGLSVSVYLEKY